MGSERKFEKLGTGVALTWQEDFREKLHIHPPNAALMREPGTGFSSIKKAPRGRGKCTRISKGVEETI